MNIKQFSEQTRLSPYTLRYYEKIGLISSVQRNSSGHREFSSRDFEWVSFIVRLKETGMPLQNIQTYSDLRAKGDSTLGQRQKLLQDHRDFLKLKIENELDHLKALENKIKFYSSQKSS